MKCRLHGMDGQHESVRVGTEFESVVHGGTRCHLWPVKGESQ